MMASRPRTSANVIIQRHFSIKSRAHAHVALDPLGGQRKGSLVTRVGEQQPLGVERRIHLDSQPMPHPHCPSRHALREWAVVLAKLLIHGGASVVLYE